MILIAYSVGGLPNCRATAIKGIDRRLGRCGGTGLLLDLLHHVEQHLGRAQIGAGRFVDHLRDDRLALGDLAPLPVDRGVDRLVQCRDQQRRSVLAARTARVGPSERVGRAAACRRRSDNLAVSRTSVLSDAAAPCGGRACSYIQAQFGNSISSHICRIQQCLGMRLSSTASPLPTAFLARRIRLSAGSAKRAECIDIARVFGVEGAIFEG